MEIVIKPNAKSEHKFQEINVNGFSKVQFAESMLALHLGIETTIGDAMQAVEKLSELSPSIKTRDGVMMIVIKLGDNSFEVF